MTSVAGADERRYRRGVAARFEMRRSSDPWGGRQPRYERLTTDGPGRYFLHARLPSGEPVRVQLARCSDPPERWPSRSGGRSRDDAEIDASGSSEVKLVDGVE